MQWRCLLVLVRLTGKKVWLVHTINDTGMQRTLGEATAGSLELKAAAVHGQSVQYPKIIEGRQ